MPQVHAHETPSEWKKRIWSRLQYFRNNDLLPITSKKYLEARKEIRYWSDVNGFWKSYSPAIGIAICFSCNQLVYTGEMSRNTENHSWRQAFLGYNHIGIERHWSTHCTGNNFCDIKYEEYLEIEQKSKLGYNYDNEYVVYRYGLWMQNAIKKVERAREVGKKIRACTIIQRKFIEFMYRPDGMTAKQLAEHYQLLWTVREEMRQVNNV